MKLCRVEGTVVGSVHHPVYDGQKLLIVTPVDGGDSFPRGRSRAGGRRRPSCS